MSTESTKSKSPELLMEQYKLYVEMTDRVSARRGEAGKLYSSLLTGLLAVISLAVGQNVSVEIQKTVFIMAATLGIALCVIWAINIRSYKQLNSLKFKVIHEMEQKLPFPCYDREWQLLKEEKSGRNYVRLTKVEQYIPFILAIPYVALLIITLWR
jgi:hypothetical protein